MTKHITLKKWQLNSIMKRDEKVITRKTFHKITDQINKQTGDWFDNVYVVEDSDMFCEHAYIDVLINNVQEARVYWSHYTRLNGKDCNRHEYKIHKNN